MLNIITKVDIRDDTPLYIHPQNGLNIGEKRMAF